MRYVVALLMLGGAANGQELPEDTNEVRAVTVEQAERLATDDGVLSLNGLKTLSPDVAVALAKHKCTGGFRSAEAPALHLDGLTAIAPEVAASIAKHKGGLSLDGLTTITPAVAEALAKCDGWLSLDGLASITPEAAVALAQHDGWLVLDGLTTLSPEVAEALAEQNGPLHLNGWFRSAERVARRRSETGGGSRARLCHTGFERHRSEPETFPNDAGNHDLELRRNRDVVHNGSLIDP